MNSDNAASCERLRDLSPPGKPYVEQRLGAQTGMHSVKNRIAVLEAQLAAQRRHLDMRSKSAVAIIENDAGGLDSRRTIRGLQDYDGILDSPITVDKQAFIGNLRPAEIPVFKHLQPRRSLIASP